MANYSISDCYAVSQWEADFDGGECQVLAPKMKWCGRSAKMVRLTVCTLQHGWWIWVLASNYGMDTGNVTLIHINMPVIRWHEATTVIDKGCVTSNIWKLDAIVTMWFMVVVSGSGVCQHQQNVLTVKQVEYWLIPIQSVGFDHSIRSRIGCGHWLSKGLVT